MGLKIRVLASPSPLMGSPVPALVYRAEAYSENDPFRQQKWSCTHVHDSPHAAYECGTDWLRETLETSTPPEIG